MKLRMPIKVLIISLTFAMTVTACSGGSATVSESDTGSIGKSGEEGVEAQVGPTGMQGIQGLTGSAGDEGEQGEVGATGPVGPQGLTGTAGPVGLQGPTGAPGPVGPQGPAGVYEPLRIMYSVSCCSRIPLQGGSRTQVAELGLLNQGLYLLHFSATTDSPVRCSFNGGGNSFGAFNWYSFNHLIESEGYLGVMQGQHLVTMATPGYLTISCTNGAPAFIDNFVATATEAQQFGVS